MKFKDQSWDNAYLSYGGKSVNFYESRNNTAFNIPYWYSFGNTYSFDPRRRIYGIVSFDWSSIPDWKNKGLYCIVEPTFKWNDHLRFSYNYLLHIDYNDRAYNSTLSDGSFGERDRKTINNSLNVSYKFNPFSNVSFDIRHYWSKVLYDRYFSLLPNGDLTEIQSPVPNSDLNINFFNIDFLYTWQFASGSYLSIIWKNSLDYFKSSDEKIREQNYFENLSKTLKAPQNNNIAIKAIYFLDFNKFHKSSKQDN